MANKTTPNTHGPYEAQFGPYDGRIIRHDADGHYRTVAFINDSSEWEDFVSAIEAGMSEVEAVHAIDA